MSVTDTEEITQQLAAIPHLNVTAGALLKNYTRFGIGGPAAVYAETADPDSFIEALRIVRSERMPYVVIGGGTNLIVSDAGYDGVVLRFTARSLRRQGTSVYADSGADLQELVDYTVAQGLKGVQTMTGIPGSVGAAVYGNAGAYGHSIMETVQTVRFFDGDSIRTFDNAQCEFHYRDSIFKRNKGWIIFCTQLEMQPSPVEELRKTADSILQIRHEKYPPSMKCAGSIFKNLILADLPPQVREVVPAKVIREGKVPSAYFLEQVGAKGLRNGDIRVAVYHANLIYNVGQGTARELTEVIDLLKSRVREHFGLDLEEEVQYVGFDRRAAAAHDAASIDFQASSS
jgi:UDP-N-acetylmuramate dehydrogenase